MRDKACKVPRDVIRLLDLSVREDTPLFLRNAGFDRSFFDALREVFDASNVTVYGMCRTYCTPLHLRVFFDIFDQFGIDLYKFNLQTALHFYSLVRRKLQYDLYYLWSKKSARFFIRPM